MTSFDPVKDNLEAGRALFALLEDIPLGEVSTHEARRTVRICDINHFPAWQVLSIVNLLDVPVGAKSTQYYARWNPKKSRDGLAAMLGIMTGCNRLYALEMVDKARARNLKDIGPFILSEAAVLAAGGSGVALGLSLGSKAAVAASSKLTQAKTATTLSKSVGYLAGGMGFAVAAAGATAVAGSVAFFSYEKMNDIYVENKEFFEEQFAKDRRILMAIKEGRSPGDNRISAEERRNVKS